MTALDVATPLRRDVLKVIAARTHSRYPVYRERIDNIVGILHVKDLIAYAATTDLRTVKIADVMRTPVVFVPETQSASSLLKDMRSGRRHLAIIIDEFGGMSGVVTLEDIIEEIVGDIQDEHDTDEPPIVDLGNGRLMVDAGVPIGDLSRYLGVELPEDGDYNSLGGFIVERLGEVPTVGETISDFGLDFVVRDSDEQPGLKRSKSSGARRRQARARSRYHRSRRVVQRPRSHHRSQTGQEPRSRCRREARTSIVLSEVGLQRACAVAAQTQLDAGHWGWGPDGCHGALRSWKTRSRSANERRVGLAGRSRPPATFQAEKCRWSSPDGSTLQEFLTEAWTT